MKATAVLPLPSAVPPGEYEVELFCFKAGELIARSSAPLIVERSGLPKLMTDLAFNHAAAYGVLAIVVAMTVGIIMGVIFRSRGGSH